MFSFISHQRDVMVCEESLRGLFSQYGPVLDCVIRSYNGEVSGQSARGLQNGYGFVEFQDQEVAEYVVKNVKAGLLAATLEPSDDTSASTPSVHVDCSLSRRSAARLAQVSGVSSHQMKRGSVESNNRPQFHQQKDPRSSPPAKPTHSKSFQPKGPEKLEEQVTVTEKTSPSPYVTSNPTSGMMPAPVVYPQHFVSSPPVYNMTPTSPIMQSSFTQMPPSHHMSSSHYFPPATHFSGPSLAPVMSNTNYSVMSMPMHPSNMVQFGYQAPPGGPSPQYLPPSASHHHEVIPQPMQGLPRREYQELHSYQYPNSIHQPHGPPQPAPTHVPQVLNMGPSVYPMESNPKENFFNGPSHLSPSVAPRLPDDRDFPGARRQVPSYPTNPTNGPVHSGNPMPPPHSQPSPQGPFYTVFYSSPPQESSQSSLGPSAYAMNAQYQQAQIPSNQAPHTHTHTNTQQPSQRYPAQHPSSHFPYYQSHHG